MYLYDCVAAFAVAMYVEVGDWPTDLDLADPKVVIPSIAFGNVPYHTSIA